MTLFAIAIFMICFRFSQLEIIEDNFDYKDTVYVSYKVDRDEETITVDVKCLEDVGWLGFGFSSTGDMPGSDACVLLYNTEGEPNFYDVHLVGRQPPVKDEEQNFELITKKKEDGVTYLSFKRKLITCDPDDYELTEATVKFIFAWSTKPADDLSMMARHEDNVGVKNVLLFQQNENHVLSADIKFWDIQANNFLVPSKSTTYYCTYHRLPEFARNKPHIFVGSAPIIQKGLEKIVHHILVQTCMGDDAKYSKLVGTSFDCTDMEQFQTGLSCQPTIVLWAFGQTEYLLPPEVGIPVGSKFGYSDYYLVQYHYANAANLEGLTDTSGIRVYLTQKKRQYEGGITNIIAYVDYTLALPPKQPEIVYTSIMPRECTELTFPPTGIKVFATGLHTHLTGRQVRIRHYRDGVELPVVSADENYDFNYQQLRPLQEYITILPGDAVTCECVYNTMDRINTTLGGVSTQEEMCFCVLMYYPATQLSYSIDGILAEDLEDFFENPYKLPLRDVIKDYDWSKVSENDMNYFKHLSKYGDKQGFCFGVNLTPLRLFRTRYPDVIKPQRKRKYCTKC